MNKQVFFLKFSNYLDYKNDYIDGNIFVGELDGLGHITNYQLGDISEAMGEFIHIGVNEEGSLEIGTDFYGFYALFWMPYVLYGMKGVLVSNCFHSLSSYVEDNQDYDFTVLLPNILAKDQIFMQSYSNETPIRSIKRLGWDQTIKINSEGYKLCSRANEPENTLSYEALLQLGIKKTQECLIQLDRKRSLNLYLSGGKDSRAILALALSTGIRPSCTTHSPEKFNGLSKEMVEKDFRITNFLVEKFSLSWYQQQKKLSTKISFSESLERHLFYRSGYYLFSPNQYFVYSADWGDEVQLRGAVGEVFKPDASWGQYIKNGFIGRELEGSSKAFDRDCILFCNILLAKNIVDSGSYDDSVSHVVNTLRDLRVSKDENIYSVLEKHYLHFRNRFHFGHMRATESEGKDIFYPLSNKYFYYANQKLSDDERNAGRLVFDIIEKCAPILNNYPYDDGYHKLLPEIRQYRMTYSNTTYENFYKTEENNAKLMSGLFSGISYNSVLEQRKFIEHSLSEVEKNSTVIFTSKFQNYLTSLESNKRTMGKLVSILGSLPLKTTESYAKNHRLIIL